MELTSKQRAQLRGLANTKQPVLQIGKDGITEALVAQADALLETHELIKIKVLENSMFTAREACDELCPQVRAEPVQCIGSKFVIYRESHKEDKTDKIVLVTAGHQRRPKPEARPEPAEKKPVPRKPAPRRPESAEKRKPGPRKPYAGGAKGTYTHSGDSHSRSGKKPAGRPGTGRSNSGRPNTGRPNGGKPYGGKSSGGRER